MAKSRLAASRVQRNTIVQPEAKDDVVSLDLSFELHDRGGAFGYQFNLLDWCYELCTASNMLAVPSRLNKMQRLRVWVTQELKNQSSESSIRGKLHSLRLYIIFCDLNKLDPFSRVGYLSYVGNNGELWRLVNVATEPKKYDFQYYDGEEAGLLESSAFKKKMHIDKLLLVLGFDVSEWQATLKPFLQQKEPSFTQPYTINEWYLLVRRVQLFFYSLATQLIALKEEFPEALPPRSLDGIVVERTSGKDITVTLGGGGINGGAGSPFNQCMAAAYVLFAYYTAFNDSVIKDVRHPIKVVTSRVEGRTSKIVQVRAYKGRSSKEVQALFLNSDDDVHPEAHEDKAGFIIADINKRDKVGDVDGVTFLQTLELLSKTYSDVSFDTLIYFLNPKGQKSKISHTHTLILLSQNLNLLSERRYDLADHLVKTYMDIVERKVMTTFRWFYRADGAKFMKKHFINLTKRGVTQKATHIAYAALSCITDVSFRNALMPLKYSKKDSDGMLTVSFKNVDGTNRCFTVAARYRPFLQLVERYAMTKNPLPKEKGMGRGGKVTKSPFLLPFGVRSVTYQYEQGKVPSSVYLLSRCGIGYGDYFLNLNSRRIRVTHADLEYRPEERGWTAEKILQHNIDTADRRYRNGHPASNDKQASQGLRILSHIAQGKTRGEAIESTKSELKIPVLEYEVWKRRNQPTNPNGISCDGHIDLVSEKNWHYSAQKFAKQNGIIEEGRDITCYQYDLCVFCKSAKLVDDPNAVYKLLSFIEALSDGIVHYPERASFIQMKIERFQAHLDDLPPDTINQAEILLEDKGRYPLFETYTSVTQFL
ncbi:TPA: hypothetical protein ACN37W_003763 [Vibrio parahaemolyticus]